MPHVTKIDAYRDHLAQLSYPEYALSHADDTRNQEHLNLSLWNNDLPPGVKAVAVRSLPEVVGSYSLAQDARLIALLAQKLGVGDGTIIITAGADDALRVVSQYCIRAGTRTLIPVPCFGRYAYHAMAHEAKVCYLRFDAYPYELDVAKICDEIQKRRIDCLFIASPNNPTGHSLSRESLKLLLGGVPSACSIILDESLLVTHGASCSSLTDKHPNLVICGSFSKLFGLPGLRVGYIVANRMHVRPIRMLVSPFGVDGFGIEIAKHVIVQDAWITKRTSMINSGIAALRTLSEPRFLVTRTSAPVALVEYLGAGGSLYRLLHERGVATISGEEFPGLAGANVVRVIIKNVKDMMRLKRVLATLP